MLVADILNPPIQYDLIWLIIGCFLAVLILSWYGFVFWLTRRKQLKSLASLKPLPAGLELDQLKAKYLRLIDECYQRHQRGEINLRTLHRDLSILARYFVFEARHFPAPILTLADLKLGPYPLLTRLIAAYYPEEFAAIGNGQAATAVEAAKGFVQQWF